MEGDLLQKIDSELEMLNTIYSEENVIEEQAKEIKTGVTCVLKLQPNTGFN